MYYLHSSQMALLSKYTETLGHLVGYDSTNIFRIWIPSKRKIIRTRGVIFDEGKFYDPSEPDLSQLITEPMIETTFEIPRSFRNTISSIEVDSDDDVAITDVNASEDVNLQPIESTEKESTETVTKPVLPTPAATPTLGELSDTTTTSVDTTDRKAASEAPEKISLGESAAKFSLYELWHARMGHTNPKKLRTLSQHVIGLEVFNTPFFHEPQLHGL